MPGLRKMVPMRPHPPRPYTPSESLLASDDVPPKNPSRYLHTSFAFLHTSPPSINFDSTKAALQSLSKKSSYCQLVTSPFSPIEEQPQSRSRSRATSKPSSFARLRESTHSILKPLQKPVTKLGVYLNNRPLPRIPQAAAVLPSPMDKTPMRSYPSFIKQRPNINPNSSQSLNLSSTGLNINPNAPKVHPDAYCPHCRYHLRKCCKNCLKGMAATYSSAVRDLEEAKWVCYACGTLECGKGDLCRWCGVVHPEGGYI